MKVLFFTRKLDKNDPRIGFAHRWVQELAGRVDRLYVVCLEKGQVDLPKNVEIHTLGKGKIRRLLRLDKLMFSLARKVDVIFCHMNPIYTIISAPYAKLYRKKLYMWHTHGKITYKLKLAHSLADGVLTASEGSFPIKSRKVRVLGHGIDTDMFAPKKTLHPGPVLISVGRISPVKRIETLIKGMPPVIKKHNNAKLLLVGDAPLEGDRVYMGNLKKLVSELSLEKHVQFLGPTDYQKMPEHYHKADLFVSASATGSLDKTVLEAMACELPVLVSGNVYKDLKGPLLFRNSEDFAGAVGKALKIKDRKLLRQEIIENHNLGKLMDKIVRTFEK
ncbi:MAG: glycosyltransferase family 4 protein [Candidatus Altiarchaeota archaeon]|nr:glycosyltransferase family 4 protein [Candidatus Altiarchaeota archaeon]